MRMVQKELIHCHGCIGVSLLSHLHITLKLKLNHYLIDHCIDSIRQSLMCSGDITPVVYHIDPRGTGLFPKLQGTHICRNYDKITEWAREHDGSNARFQFREGDALLDLYRLDPQGYMQKGGSE